MSVAAFRDPFDQYIKEALAKRPHDGEGRPLCGSCKAVIGAEEYTCTICREKAEEAERIQRLNREIRRELQTANETIPAWSWARARDPVFLERVKHPKLRALAQAWEPKRGSVTITHESGTGKTATKIAMAHGLLDAGARAAREARTTKPGAAPLYDLARGLRWVSALELVAARRGHALGRGECDLWQTAATASVLFLDEIGQEQAAPGWLLELLDLRYKRGRPTLSSSGLTRSELEKRYGSGACRRLVEPGGVWLDLFPESTGG